MPLGVLQLGDRPLHLPGILRSAVSVGLPLPSLIVLLVLQRFLPLLGWVGSQNGESGVAALGFGLVFHALGLGLVEVGLLVPGLVVLDVHGLGLEVDGLLGPGLVLDDVLVALTLGFGLGLGLSLVEVDTDALALDAAPGLDLVLLLTPGIGLEGVAQTG